MTPGLLGKKAARHDKRTLKLSDYTKALPKPPGSAFYDEKVKAWGMMMNDTLGDCVAAGAGHMIEQWTTYAGNPFRPSDPDILKVYEDVGGYVPGDPSTDNGMVMLDALNYWRNHGIAGHKIAAYVTLDGGSEEQLRQAVHLFGNAYVGLALPLTAQSQDGCWKAVSGPDSEPGSWGGHCVPIVGYDAAALKLITWGSTMYMTPGFLAYCDEAYAVLSFDWIGKNATAPNGFDVNQLLADLHEIT